MKVRTFNEMYDVLIKKGFDKVAENRITGDTYEEWNKERFISEVDREIVKNKIYMKETIVYNYKFINECVSDYCLTNDDEILAIKFTTDNEESLWNSSYNKGNSFSTTIDHSFNIYRSEKQDNLVLALAS